MEVLDDEIDGLAASIGRLGVLVPLVIHSEGDVYNIIAGHRRYAAAVRAGLAEVPCIVRDSKEAESSEVAFAENIFRQDLSPVEVGSGIKDVLDKKIMDVPTVAAAMHRSAHWVLAQVDILTWPADVLEAIHEGRLSVSAANNLALVSSADYRAFLLRNAVEQGATARTTAAWLQAWRAQMPPETAVMQPPVDGRQTATPALPQCPCIVCNGMFRTDALAMVLVCTGCINTIRGAVR